MATTGDEQIIEISRQQRPVGNVVRRCPGNVVIPRTVGGVPVEAPRAQHDHILLLATLHHIICREHVVADDATRLPRPGVGP